MGAQKQIRGKDTTVFRKILSSRNYLTTLPLLNTEILPSDVDPKLRSLRINDRVLRTNLISFSL